MVTVIKKRDLVPVVFHLSGISSIVKSAAVIRGS